MDAQYFFMADWGIRFDPHIAESVAKVAPPPTPGPCILSRIEGMLLFQPVKTDVTGGGYTTWVVFMAGKQTGRNRHDVDAAC